MQSPMSPPTFEEDVIFFIPINTQTIVPYWGNYLRYITYRSHPCLSVKQKIELLCLVKSYYRNCQSQNATFIRAAKGCIRTKTNLMQAKAVGRSKWNETTAISFSQASQVASTSCVAVNTTEFCCCKEEEEDVAEPEITEEEEVKEEEEEEEVGADA